MLESTPRLRPRGVAEIIDAIFALYRQNFVLFLGVVAVLTVPETILNMVIVASLPTASSFNQGTNGGTFVSAFNTYSADFAGSTTTGLIGGVFDVLIMGALARAISLRFLGRPVTILQAYTSVGLSRFLRLIAVLVLGFIAFVAVALAVSVIIVFGTIALFNVAAALGVTFAILASLAAVAFLMYATVHFAVVAQCVVLEDTGVIGAYVRSWRLVRGYWWRVLGLLALLAIIVGVFNALAGVFAAVLSLGHPVLLAGIAGILGMVAQPIQLGGVTLLYYDQRIRKEGFDLEYAARAARGVSPA